MNWILESREVDDVVIIDVLKFRRSDYEREELRDIVVAHLVNGKKKILVNLANKHGFDDAAVGELMACYSSSTNCSANLAIVGVHKNLYAFLEIIKLTPILKIFSNEAEALESFR